MKRSYSTNLSDIEWEYLEPHVPPPNNRGRPRVHTTRQILDAIFYVLKSGCSWRLLPRDFPPWETVYCWFRRWRLDGTWERLNAALREHLRVRLGRDAHPSAGVVDSQSAKSDTKNTRSRPVQLFSKQATKLDKEKSYGVWWFNRERIVRRRVVKNSEGGREYRYCTTRVPKPRSEWVAVPVPDAGVPREWVEAAREAIKNNRRPSDAGRRFWELSGRLLFCGACGRAMTTRTTKGAKERRKLYYYYACLPKDREACLNRKKVRAQELESSVWELVSALLTDPEQLREDLKRMIEQERKGSRGDPEAEAQAWLEKISEVGRMRGNYQEMAAKGLMTFEELEEKFEELEETRAVAERELAALKGLQEFVEQLERDGEALLESYLVWPLWRWPTSTPKSVTGSTRCSSSALKRFLIAPTTFQEP